MDYKEKLDKLFDFCKDKGRENRGLARSHLGSPEFQLYFNRATYYVSQMGRINQELREVKDNAI